MLKFSGLAEIEKLDHNLTIQSTQPFLGFDFNSDSIVLDQRQNQDTRRFGYELQTSTKFEKSKLNFYQGIFYTEDDFKNKIILDASFDNNIETERNDSYIGMSYRGKISRRLKYITDVAYKHIFFSRFNNTFDKYLFLPKLSIDYTINASKRLDMGYSYDLEIPLSEKLNNSPLINNYFNLTSISRIKQDQVFPSHTFNTSFSNFKSSTGSNYFIFANYNYFPEFLSISSFLDSQNVVNSQNIVGTDRHSLFLGANTTNRFKKLKLTLFINTSWLFNQEENQINLQDNIATISKFKQKTGIYSRFRKGINYSVGIDYEITNYKTTVNSIKAKSSATKPYMYLTGSLFDKNILWSFGGEYAIYKTDRTQTEIFDIKPSIVYEPNENWKFMIEGNNILNVGNSEITENINATNYNENSISDTLEGYLVFGIYYRIK